MAQETSSSLRTALQPSALREALAPRRPVFSNPWDSTEDAFACYLAVSVVDPLLLWVGGKLMGSIFNFSSRWPLGMFMVAALVGAAGFMTIVGRERTRLSVDILAIAAWVLLGLVVAPVIGLALSTLAALICYAILLLATFVYVLRFGRWETAFYRTVTWPMTWSLAAVFFAYCAHRLVLYS
ncbi:MAG TPA: hypothetical protein VGH45_06330 [Solirubrobacteraceae bacterium]|jgi:hypothetical protein